MTLFQIDEEFNKLFDQETGEIFDIEAFEQLEMARDQKLRNIVCFYKRLTAEAKAIKDAEAELKKRRTAKENSAERLLNLIDSYQGGNPFECTEGKLSYRKSTKTELVNEEAFNKWEGRWAYGKSEFTPSKEMIGTALKAGQDIPGWAQVEHLNASIK